MRISFFPHSYLRDRHWDTIDAWPVAEAPEKPTRRVGAQVKVDLAAKGNVSLSWLSKVPLINCRMRPRVHRENVVYIWGGMTATGKFISDLDNPYALTFYNLKAMRVYRSLIGEILAHPRCLRINCMSDACRRAVSDLFGPRVGRKAVVRYPRMSLRFNGILQTSTACRFLFISTQFDIKGGPALLRAFAQVRKVCPNATLDLITHLPERHRALAEQPGCVVHSANLSREEIAERFMSRCDVLVHPTYVDSFGMVVLEALCWGMALIATDVYALREMCVDGLNGLLLQPPISCWDGVSPSLFHHQLDRADVILDALSTSDFEKSLAEAMIELSRNPVRRQKMREESLRLLRTRFMPLMRHHL